MDTSGAKKQTKTRFFLKTNKQLTSNIAVRFWTVTLQNSTAAQLSAEFDVQKVTLKQQRHLTELWTNTWLPCLIPGERRGLHPVPGKSHVPTTVRPLVLKLTAFLSRVPFKM